MKTIAISFALATASVAMAHAQATTTQTKCTRDFQGDYACTTTTNPSDPNRPPPKMTTQEQAEIDARATRWEEYCKPQIVQDRDGIDRYRYAKPGCDMGKSRP